VKAYLLLLYSVSLFITLNAWYKQGNSGVPDPSVIAPATYVFALLLLAANFLDGLPAIIGTSMTFILYLRAHGENPSGVKAKTNPKSKLKLGAK
jgi:hypothetical protein